MKKFILVSILLFAGISGPVSFTPGTTSGNFLRLPIGPRALAMGGATFVSIADDGSAIFWNPAGLAQYDKGNLIGGFMNFIADIEIQYFSFGLPISLKHKLAIGMTTLSTEPIDVYTYSDIERERIFTQFNISDNVLIFNYGYMLSNFAMLGINLKLFKEELYTYINDTTLTGDFGVIFKTGKNLNFGLSVQNIGGSLRFIQHEETLPRITRIGASYQNIPFRDFATLTFGIAIESSIDEPTKFAFGTETWLKDLIAFRIGYKREDLSGLSYGIGGKVAFKKIDPETKKIIEKFALFVDWASSPHGDFGNVQKFSIGTRF